MPSFTKPLATAGVTVENITLLRVRASALREAEVQWRITYNSEQEDVKNWEEQSLQGYAMNNDFNAVFRFAYRKDAQIS